MARQIVAVVPNTQENSLYSEPTRNNDHETRLKKIKIKEIIKAFTSR